MNVRYAGLFAAFVLTASGQSIHDLFGTEQFHRAYFDHATQEITFDSFQQINWDAKARAALPWLNFNRPTPAQIARMSTFESAGPRFRSIDFRAPLDPVAGRAPYVLIAISAVTPILPVQLKGSVAFDFNQGMSAVEHKTVSGTIAGEPAVPATTPAFVVMGELTQVTEVHAGAKFEKRKSPDDGIYDFADGNRIVSWTAQETEPPAVDSSLSFRLNGRRFLLVKWNSGNCDASFTLFSVNAKLTPIASNDYDCDP